MNDKIEIILEQAGKLFMKYGIKSLTMDDIAREMGISKKTLYQFVADKSELVTKVMEEHFKRERCNVEELLQQSKNAIDELFQVMENVKYQIKEIHPSIHYDLQKYYPDGWKIFCDHRNSFVYSCVKQNIERGIEQGLFRNDFNVDIVTRIYISRLDIVFNAELFPADKFIFTDVHKEMVFYHMRAILSPKGLKYLEKKLETKN
jgi:TetR/AcrR family transcriptional regulator, cholesterol catabolism regulator